MPARRVATILIALALLPQVAHAGGPAPGAGTHPRFSVQASSHGLVVTLFVTQPSYPQNALVKVTVRLWNSTSAPLQLMEPTPTVSVLWPSGKIAYSEAEGRYPAQVVSLSSPFKEPTGGIPAPFTIRPGQAIARHVLVVMRTGRLQASVSLVGSTAVLKTPVLLVRLGRALYPQISFRKESSAVVATITPTSPRQAGTLWYMSAMRCYSSGGITGETGTTTWTRVLYADHRPDGSYRLPAPSDCPTPRQWSLAAGWLSQPLAVANYAP